MDIKEYEELFGKYELQDEERLEDLDVVVAYATKEECESLLKKYREEKRKQRELERAIEEEKIKRWNSRQSKYRVIDVYLVEKNGKPVEWYYDKYEACCAAYEWEQEDFLEECEENGWE